jgi:hypothetical protein
MGIAVLTMAAGVLVISAAYAAGRHGSPGSAWHAAYWLGEALLFGPLAWRLLSRSGPGESEAAGLVLCAAAATYLVKVAYSPAAFRFPDELEHLRTTSNLLSSHHLFGVNYLLPVSAFYPGLEEVTGAVVTLTGLPVFTAGLIVAGLAHVLFAAALFVVFRQVSGSPRIAAAACAIYATNPHYQVFDAIYGYQTLALAFFGLALVAALGRTRWVLAVTLIAATMITHHVTSYVLAGSLLLLAGIGATRRHGTVRIAVLAGACLGLVVLWVALAAPGTVSYLEPTVRGLTGVFTSHRSAGSGAPAGPLTDQLASYAATALIMIGLPFGWWQIWRKQRHNTWALALGAGSSAYYLAALVRVAVPDGSELAGRSLTFIYIPVGYTLAMAAAGPVRVLLQRITVPRRITRSSRPAFAAAAGILLVGGIAAGWPPYWERLPGQYFVDGFESGITTEGIAAATWARTTLGPGQRIAADFTNYLLLGSYGDQDPVGDLDELYCGPGWTDDDEALANQQAIGYLLVDLRMSEQAAVTGGYFADSSAVCPSPIPRQDLTKFDAVPGFDRVYDSGNIVIYARAGAQDAP